MWTQRNISELFNNFLFLNTIYLFIFVSFGHPVYRKYGDETTEKSLLSDYYKIKKNAKQSFVFSYLCEGIFIKSKILGKNLFTKTILREQIKHKGINFLFFL